VTTIEFTNLTEQVPPTEGRISPGRSRLTRELVIDGDRAEALWEMYREAFEPLETVAIQQHLWSKEDVLAELADDRIVKFIVSNDDGPVGMCMITNSLDLVPMISPVFLRSLYPQHAERDAIFYGIMIFVKAGSRGRTTFARLGAHMAQEAALSGGVVVFDMCRFNRESRALDDNLLRLSAPFKNSSMSVVDQQTWLAVELPEPLATLDGRPTFGRRAAPRRHLAG
jgi:hypothetical protein